MHAQVNWEFLSLHEGGLDIYIRKIVACMEDKKVVRWHQALAGYATGYQTSKCTYVQIEYLSRVHAKGNFEKIPGHNFFKLSLMIHTSI